MKVLSHLGSQQKKENKTNSFLIQKLEHIQQELENVIKIKNWKEQECRQYISELSKKDNLIIQKNNRIQELWIHMEKIEQAEEIYKNQIDQLSDENDELKNNYHQLENELQEYKEKLESLQGDLEDIKTKSIDKESEIFNYSKMYEERNQEQLSALKNKYDEVKNNLMKELNNTKDTEMKEKIMNRDMQKTINDLKVQNEELKNQLLYWKEANSKQRNMINIVSSPREEKKEINGQKILELENQISELKQNEESQEEVSYWR